MNLLDVRLGPVRRLLRRGPLPTCLVCKGAILPSDERMQFHGDTVVHRRCATYSMRNRTGSSSRLGFPR